MSSAPEPIFNDYDPEVLLDWGYRLYDNGTLSNSTQCYLSFGNFQPIIEVNGTVVNGTSCDYPYYHMKSRGAIGITLAVLAMASLPVSLYHLRKHGMRHGHEHKQFRVVGRRWQWYWLLVLQALCAVVGYFSIDIDRDYLQGTSLTIYGAVLSAMLPIALAAVWEKTRHWCAFEERKIYEDDPFRFGKNDRRSTVQILVPIGFYFFDFLLFLLTVVRDWTGLADYNNMFTVDDRWKAGEILGIMAFLWLFIVCLTARHYYRPKKLDPSLPFAWFGVFVLVVYNIAMTFDRSISPFNPKSNVAAVALLEYVPAIYLIVVFNISGYLRENEDLFILRYRRQRDLRTETELLERVTVQPTKETESTDSSSPSTTSLSELSLPALSESPPPYSDTRSYTAAEIKALAKARMRSSANS
ncbi:hypothetical protein V1511DRAFT_506921 [Dipodascopsis uninucleata]